MFALSLRVDLQRAHMGHPLLLSFLGVCHVRPNVEAEELGQKGHADAPDQLLLAESLLESSLCNRELSDT